MAHFRSSRGLVLAALLLASLSLSNGAEASPTIESIAPPKPQEITGKVEPVLGGESKASHQSGPTLAPKSATGKMTTISAPPLAALPAASQASARPANISKQHQLRNANTAEKLKRGLTNFMNHLNPAPFFVPPPMTPAKLAAGSQAEPATIINDGPSADVLIKGPNRLVQARPLGGPLRWGRRR